MRKEGEQIQIFRKVRTNVGALIMCLVFTLISVWMILDQSPPEPGDLAARPWFGVFGLLLFGAGFVIFGYMLVLPKPLAILDREGITQRQLGREMLMRWTEVKRAYIVENTLTPMQKHVYVAVAPKNPEPFLAQIKKMNQASLIEDGERFRFLFVQTELSNDELLALIRQYMAKYGAPEAPPQFSSYPRSNA